MKKTAAKFLTLGLAVTMLTAPLTEASASTGSEELSQSTYLGDSENKDFKAFKPKEDPIITPQYIPIPYNYIYTRFYSNATLGSWLSTIDDTRTGVGATTAVLGIISIPSTIARPIAATGYSVGNIVNRTYDEYSKAYHKGQGMQVIVRKNPNFNGYNSRHFVEWIPSYSRMQ
ncbi:hypothetical protein [Guptibacillus sedimenti]|uniref:hypothetical protein n=1 Tax=Guptibacillus sedimenti TaxID=3025680 RepID=UPI00236088F0|nr:hypothetical protein [Pseudalkalibacillus sedimenti]